MRSSTPSPSTRVDHPHAASAEHRVAGALHPRRLGMDPADREVELVAEADGRHRGAGARPTWIAPAISAMARCDAVEMVDEHRRSRVSARAAGEASSARRRRAGAPRTPRPRRAGVEAGGHDVGRRHAHEVVGNDRRWPVRRCDRRYRAPTDRWPSPCRPPRAGASRRRARAKGSRRPRSPALYDHGGIDQYLKGRCRPAVACGEQRGDRGQVAAGAVAADPDPSGVGAEFVGAGDDVRGMPRARRRPAPGKGARERAGSRPRRRRAPE